MKPASRIILTALSIVVAGCATWYWLKAYSVSVADLDTLMANLDWRVVPLILLLLCIHVSLSGLRWSRIETLLGGEAPHFYRAYATGAFALGLGTFLPGPVANVLCRSISNRLYGTSGLRGAIGGGLDQVSDFLVVCVFAPPALVAIALGESWAYIAGCGVVGFVGWLAIWHFPALPGGMVPSFLKNRFATSVALLDRKSTSEIYCFSLARFVNLSLITVLIHFASGAASVSAAIIAVPLVTMAISVAMLPGAFGVSEWSFSGSFAALGIPTPEIAIFVLANRLVLTCLGFVVAATGFLPMLQRQHRPDPMP